MIALITGCPLFGSVPSLLLSISKQTVTPFFSAYLATFLNPAMQFLAPSSNEKFSENPVKAIHVWASEIRGFVDGLLRRLDQPSMILRIIEALDERSSVHRCRRSRRSIHTFFKPPVFGINQFDALATKILGMLTGFFHAPMFGKAPRYHRLIDPTLRTPFFLLLAF